MKTGNVRNLFGISPFILFRMIRKIIPKRKKIIAPENSIAIPEPMNIRKNTAKIIPMTGSN
jgi:hypothetical protein